MKPVSLLQQDKELAKDGFLLNHAKVLVGSGHDTYEKAKNALQTWRSVRAIAMDTLNRFSIVSRKTYFFQYLNYLHNSVLQYIM